MIGKKIKSAVFVNIPLFIVGRCEFEDTAFMAYDIVGVEHMLHIEGQVRKRTEELNLDIYLIQTIVLM
jgi:hypothetical protein